jgi:hypothetical protein
MSNAEISKRANDDRANNRGADGMTGAMAEEQRRLHAIAVRNDCPAGGIWDE